MNSTKKEKQKSPLVLLILDGWGIGSQQEGNAIKLAKTPFWDSLEYKFPYMEIKAHGKFVGLPHGQVGNSEAGHLNIGGGRVVEQDIIQINRSIQKKDFFRNPALKKTIEKVNKNKSDLHLMGLLSDNLSPHSSTRHILALLKMARENQVSQTYLHLFTDGRDSFPYEAIKLISSLQKKLRKNEKIVTVMGRFYAMDRNKRWSRTQKAYEALTSNKAEQVKNIPNAISRSYNKGISDEYIEPIILKNNISQTRIKNRDGVIFFNLRSDRARQLTKPFVQENFRKKNPGSFKRHKFLKDLTFTALTDFGPDLDSISSAFKEKPLEKTLPQTLAGKNQIYMSESEKYAHVTYFFNGGHKKKLGGEDYFVIPSPKVRSYAQTPEMKSRELSRELVKKAKTGKYDLLVLNLAAPDMIGHTGNLEAGIKCCEIIDDCLKNIVDHINRLKGKVIITADHGNIEKLIDLETGKINTKHTINPVPLILTGFGKEEIKLRSWGSLSDISPTILDLLELKQPLKMSGRSLIIS